MSTTATAKAASLSIILEVNSAATTAWLPKPTAPLASNPECFEQIYQLNAESLIAFDVVYKRDVMPTATQCLPPQVASWWLQDQTATQTVTKLGPDFECPGMYSEVQALTESKSTRFVMCCPTGYDLATAASPKGFAPTQCTSTITQNQLVSFAARQTDGVWRTTSTLNTGAAKRVYAQHVNGYSVSSTTTSSSLSSSSTSTTTSTQLSAQNTTFPGSAGNEAPSDGLATPVKIGIGIGAGLGGLIVILALVWFLIRRRKMGEEGKGVEMGSNMEQQPVFEKGNDPTRVEMGGADGGVNGNGRGEGFGASHYDPMKEQQKANRPYELQ